ncbi:MAG: hypothetical protein H0W63_09800 [Gemmatimonadaceae bacterium]|nr:hypothetical protein [Gemmatimonadaceae bacterium]
MDAMTIEMLAELDSLHANGSFVLADAIETLKERFSLDAEGAQAVIRTWLQRLCTSYEGELQS